MTHTPLKLQPASQTPARKKALNDWRILVVDDEEEVHAVTRMILGKIRYKERGIELLSAYSGVEARTILEQED